MMKYKFFLIHNFIPIIIIASQITIILCYDHRHYNKNNNKIVGNKLLSTTAKISYPNHENGDNNKVYIKNNINKKRGLLRNTSLRASSGGNYNGMNGKGSKQKGNNNNNNDDEWLEDNDESIYMRLNEDNNLPVINNNIYNALEQTLGEMITTSAIDTLSYYMIEFHDDDTQRWMISFKNYKKQGFKSNNNDKNNNNDNKDADKLSWQSYIEDMIRLDTQYFKVYVDPPRVASRLKDVKVKDKNLKVMYIDEIQPRKIAHRLISVREDVANEVLVDLG